MTVTLVCFDDWQGLYIDSMRVQEGHRIDPRDIFGHIEGHFIDEARTAWIGDDSWVEALNGSFPFLLAELEPYFSVSMKQNLTSRQQLSVQNVVS